MDILKLALIGTLRIALFGALKVALFAYILFLPDNAYSGAKPERTWDRGVINVTRRGDCRTILKK